MQTLEPKTLPKLTKLTKTAKIQIIKDAISTGNFDRDQMRQMLDIKDRQVRRYLNEIAQQDAATNLDGTHILRTLCLQNLIKKAALDKLSTTSEVAIVLAGEAKKLDVKQEIKEIRLEWQIDEPSKTSNKVHSTPGTVDFSQ